MRQTYRKGDANMQYLSADNDGMWLVDISKVWEYEPMEHWMDGWFLTIALLKPAMIGQHSKKLPRNFVKPPEHIKVNNVHFRYTMAF